MLKNGHIGRKSIKATYIMPTSYFINPLKIDACKHIGKETGSYGTELTF